MAWKASEKISIMYLLIGCSSAHALAIETNPLFPNGFTIGAGIGMTAFIANTTYDTSAVNTLNIAGNRNSKYGELGNLALGYGRHFSDKFYLGAEIGLNALNARQISFSNTTQNSTAVTDGTVTTTINNSLSTTTQLTQNRLMPILDFKPGLFLGSDTLFFGRVGMSFNTIDLNTTSSYNSYGQVERNNNPPSASTFSTFYDSSTRHSVGLRTGLGFEYLVTKNIGISANYIYTGYNRIKLNGTQATNEIACDTFEGCSVDGNGKYKTSNNSKVSAQDVMLQLIYHIT